jgi:hypothetical protein
MSRIILTLCLVAGCVQGFQSSTFRPSFAHARYVHPGMCRGWAGGGPRKREQLAPAFVMLKCLRGAEGRGASFDSIKDQNRRHMLPLGSRWDRH